MIPDSFGINLRLLAFKSGHAESTNVFRDYPVAKGCTSPFAPIWIDYLVTHS